MIDRLREWRGQEVTGTQKWHALKDSEKSITQVRQQLVLPREPQFRRDGLLLVMESRFGVMPEPPVERRIGFRPGESQRRVRLIASALIHLYEFKNQVAEEERRVKEAAEDQAAVDPRYRRSSSSVQDTLVELRNEDVEQDNAGINKRLETSVANYQRELVLEFRDTDWTIQHLRVLYSAYDPGYWFFEAVECLRRLALTGFLGVLPSNVAKVHAALLISFVSFVLYSSCEPFRFDVADNLQTIIQAVTFVQLFIALLLIEGVKELFV